MGNVLADRLRAIAAQLEAQPNAPGESRTPAEPAASAADDYAKMTWLPDGTLAADFWVRGRVGAAKGCHNEHWAQAMLTLGLMNTGYVPLHLSVVTAIPKGLPWFSSLKSAADVGWIDGAGYNPIPVEGRRVRYIAAGCPTANANGVYATDGSLADSNAWRKVWDGLAASRDPRPGEEAYDVRLQK